MVNSSLVAPCPLCTVGAYVSFVFSYHPSSNDYRSSRGGANVEDVVAI